MPTKDEMRDQIAALREELAAERGKNEVLREQAGQHGCHCAGAGWYWCVACAGMRLPGHACTYTWTAPNYGTTPFTVTCGEPPSGSGGISTATMGYSKTDTASWLS